MTAVLRELLGGQQGEQSGSESGSDGKVVTWLKSLRCSGGV